MNQPKITKSLRLDEDAVKKILQDFFAEQFDCVPEVVDVNLSVISETQGYGIGGFQVERFEYAEGTVTMNME